MVVGYLGTLTTEERTMLHLLNQQLPAGGWEAPPSLTQAGISAAVHVQRKHIPRTLKRMEKNGLLSVAQRHIPGGKQRKRVYTLTEPGREMANSLAERVLSEQVKQGDSTTALSEVWNRNEPILELLSRVDEGLILQDAPLVSPVSNPTAWPRWMRKTAKIWSGECTHGLGKTGKSLATNNRFSTKSWSSSECTLSVCEDCQMKPENH